MRKAYEAEVGLALVAPTSTSVDLAIIQLVRVTTEPDSTYYEIFRNDSDDVGFVVESEEVDASCPQEADTDSRVLVQYERYPWNISVLYRFDFDRNQASLSGVDLWGCLYFEVPVSVWRDVLASEVWIYHSSIDFGKFCGRDPVDHGFFKEGLELSLCNDSVKGPEPSPSS